MNVINPEHKGLEERINEIAAFFDAYYAERIKSYFKIGTGFTEIPPFMPEMPQNHARGIVVVSQQAPNPEGVITATIYPTLFGEVDMSFYSQMGSQRLPGLVRRRFKSDSHQVAYEASRTALHLQDPKHVLEVNFQLGKILSKTAHFHHKGSFAASVEINPRKNNHAAVLVLPYPGLLSFGYEVDPQIAANGWEIARYGKLYESRLHDGAKKHVRDRTLVGRRKSLYD